ncbi:MAG TPA: TolC family protein [Bryobacteraceae bacterium]|nr:TolC family protein [Bryobacteraceae bacterium]
MTLGSPRSFRLRNSSAPLMAALFFAAFAFPQQPFVSRPESPLIWRPYRPASVPASRTLNSGRLYSFLRAGRLYLTLQDAIGLAIENNLDLEIDRYGPLQAQWALERQQAGGPIRGVPAGNNFVNQVTAGQCIGGALQSAGLSTAAAAGGGANTNTQISQIGPITPNLDPVFQNSSAWSHSTGLYPNTTLSASPSLVDVSHRISSFVQQGLVSGGFAQLSVNESYCRENSPSDILVPSFAPVAQLYLRHNLLNGFGTAVNSRFIRVAQNNLAASRETFRSQLLNLVADVVNLYWDLVAARQDLDARRQTLEIAEKFLQDTKTRIQVGEIAGFEVFRAQAEYASRAQEVSLAQAALRQREVVLKDALSRQGLADPLLDQAEVVPMDRLPIPAAADDLPPLRDLVAKAMAQRPDITRAKFDGLAQQISALGTRNGVLPYLQGVVSAAARAEAGTYNPASGVPPDPRSLGGFATAFGQILAGDYVSRQASLVFQGALHNRIAQADYGIDQLQLGQAQLLERRAYNQLVVDVSNQLIALRQSRSRYSQAVGTRVFEEQLLDQEQQRFLLGGSSVDQVVAAQRSLAAARYAEIAALASYSRARVSLDRVLGQTLEANRVSLAAALSGAPSVPPPSASASQPRP